MYATDKGELFRSAPLTYANGATRLLDMSFLHGPMNKMKAPVVREVLIHFRGDISGVTGGFDNEDGCAIFSQVLSTARQTHPHRGAVGIRRRSR